MAGSSSGILNPFIDDFCFSALFDDEKSTPIAGEKCAHELPLQEALISSIFSPSRKRPIPIKEEKENLKKKVKSEKDEGEFVVAAGICPICTHYKPKEEMFRNDKCSHSFSSDCIGKYVVSKIQDNISMVKCPHLTPTAEAFWIRSSVVPLFRRKYCPLKDCLAMMVDDGEGLVTVSVCPSCHRLFCAQCNVSWHEVTGCGKFQIVARTGGTTSSSVREEQATEKMPH
ncbi:E3 ubiquitin-protein ligase RSL1-like [Humulus lupulus]|uniref:E3 ubiquitin-protein ligase RSL1-like n=1 Tax=Humulus lupulus TaxID=3486 RepID=UPI002B409B81|nr:E3 ubiquitin-protein ligase RSL1-like [Humulus lupulus]